VKITVIATGFREIPSTRHAHQPQRTSFAAAHDNAMQFPEMEDSREPISDMPEHIMSAPEPAAVVDENLSYAGSVPAAGMQETSDRANDSVSLESVRAGVLNSALTNMAGSFEQDDLDVPAFLRKRNEVM
jgi:hypothetical protein